MKKIFTFLFCSVVVSSAFAQTNRDWNNKSITVVFGNSKNNQKNYQHNDRKPVYQNNSYALYQKNLEIQKVNYQYDCQVQQVMNNRYLSRRAKRNAIKNLQAQKDQQINSINCKYSTATVYDNGYGHNDHHGDNGHGR